MNIAAMHSQACKLAALVAQLRSITVPPSRRAEVDALIEQAETKLQQVRQHLSQKANHGPT
jgi:hypothetical protein